MLVDVEDLPIGTDVERPPVRESNNRHEDAVRFGNFLVGVGEDRVVAGEGLGEFLVG